MTKISSVVSFFLAASMLSACAQNSQEISATYVSPNEYQNYSCGQLRDEANRVARKASSAMSEQDRAAQNDGTAVAVGAILFWPALFFIKGDKENATEVAELKGQMEAIERANVLKSCGIKFQTY